MRDFDCHRARARGEPEADHRRRADHRARRHHPGADPRPAARPQRRAHGQGLPDQCHRSGDCHAAHPAAPAPRWPRRLRDPVGAGRVDRGQPAGRLVCVSGREGRPEPAPKDLLDRAAAAQSLASIGIKPAKLSSLIVVEE